MILLWLQDGDVLVKVMHFLPMLWKNLSPSVLIGKQCLETLVLGWQQSKSKNVS